jgi:hypothetical protein
MPPERPLTKSLPLILIELGFGEPESIVQWREEEHDPWLPSLLITVTLPSTTTMLPWSTRKSVLATPSSRVYYLLSDVIRACRNSHFGKRPQPALQK